jgi:hypothetical protein
MSTSSAIFCGKGFATLSKLVRHIGAHRMIPGISINELRAATERTLQHNRSATNRPIHRILLQIEPSGGSSDTISVNSRVFCFKSTIPLKLIICSLISGHIGYLDFSYIIGVERRSREGRLGHIVWDRYYLDL